MRYLALTMHSVQFERVRHIVRAVPCPCCGEADETVDHYLLFCPAHDYARHLLHLANPLARYPKHLLADPEILPAFFAFVQRTGRFHSVFGDFAPLEQPYK
ncbi:hypothetical protein DFH09DRAFT_1329990 [Mycena vulgaris]|nr:hypothetical protein DFH09DRAFT_1329990 [Mycena vulgaris]